MKMLSAEYVSGIQTYTMCMNIGLCYSSSHGSLDSLNTRDLKNSVFLAVRERKKLIPNSCTLQMAKPNHRLDESYVIPAQQEQGLQVPQKVAQRSSDGLSYSKQRLLVSFWVVILT